MGVMKLRVRMNPIEAFRIVDGRTLLTRDPEDILLALLGRECVLDRLQSGMPPRDTSRDDDYTYEEHDAARFRRYDNFYSDDDNWNSEDCLADEWV